MSPKNIEIESNFFPVREYAVITFNDRDKLRKLEFLEARYIKTLGSYSNTAKCIEFRFKGNYQHFKKRFQEYKNKLKS